MSVQPPAATDIAIPIPPPRDENDFDLMVRYLWQTAKTNQFNATLERQARAALLALFGKTVSEVALGLNAAVIANPPTQANVLSVQASLNAAIVQLNAVSAVLGALADAVNTNLRSLPATSS